MNIIKKLEQQIENCKSIHKYLTDEAKIENKGTIRGLEIAIKFIKELYELK